MELTGKIIAEFNERGGISNRTGNEWKAKSYVLEVPGEFPRKLVFDVFGVDRLQAFNIQIGELLTVHFDIDAHEYNGRWCNEIRAYNVIRGGQQPVVGQPVAAPSAATSPFPPAQEPAGEGSSDDLPF